MAITRYLSPFLQKVNSKFIHTFSFALVVTVTLASLRLSLSSSPIWVHLCCSPFPRKSQKDSIALTGKFTKLRHTYKCILLVDNAPKLQPRLRHGQPDQWLKLAISYLIWVRWVVLPQGQIESLYDLTGLSWKDRMDLVPHISEVLFYLPDLILFPMPWSYSVVFIP